MDNLPPTVIGVPGLWENHEAIVRAIAEQSDGYLFADRVITHGESEERFGLEIYEHDPRMREAFEIVGGGQIPSEDLDQIEQHTFTLYLIGPGEKNADYLRSMMRATMGLLKAGGLGVKIESTGISHSKVRWAELLERDPLLGVLFGFVVYITDSNGTTCSCGMHSIGLPDALVDGMPEDDAVSLLKSFVGFQFLEEPELGDGETFQAGDDQPVYTLHKEECSFYDEDDLFFNGNGMWRLVRKEPA